ncbi:MAG: sporulation transcriptional regulator SpoIIID [Clostridiales bacterium]|nr:sporulation transcriptional regulator SpoIIID [Clostridiales bacterium]
MKDYIARRAVAVAEYVLTASATVRSAAHRFGISKSTVHKDVTERLVEIDRALAKEVAEVLAINLSERHLRGGEATRRKYAEETRGSDGFSK